MGMWVGGVSRPSLLSRSPRQSAWLRASAHRPLPREGGRPPALDPSATDTPPSGAPHCARVLHLLRAHVALGHVQALDVDALALGIGPQHAPALAAILSSDHTP